MGVMRHHERTSASGRKEPQRPVRLDETEGTVVIEGRAYPAKEVVEALTNTGYTQLRTAGNSLILGKKRITPIFKSRQERAMASLCHGSLAFCCPLSKRCPQRDRALEVLGLTPDQYRELKKGAHSSFMEAAVGIPEVSQRYGQEREKSVNRPAIDRGYGGDDYRRDFDELDRTISSSDDYSRKEYHHSREKNADHRRREDRYAEPDRFGVKRSYQEDERSESCQCSTSSGSIQRIRDESEESIDGIGALFQQDGLSPFKEEAHNEATSPAFCFSCGRSVEPSTRTCPYCGARL
jgi:predicted metal-binding transcription factor (methanogenesis marker protein 9)